MEEYHKRMERQSGRSGDYDDYEDAVAFSEAAQGTGGPGTVGCFGAESALGSDKVLTGGKTGAHLSLALQWAGQKGKRYVAVARAGVDGHAFAFNDPPDMDAALDVDDGCDAPCSDIDQFSCGCADAVCREHGAPPATGEQNARRWVVYEVRAAAQPAWPGPRLTATRHRQVPCSCDLARATVPCETHTGPA